MVPGPLKVTGRLHPVGATTQRPGLNLGRVPVQVGFVLACFRRGQGLLAPRAYIAETTWLQANLPPMPAPARRALASAPLPWLREKLAKLRRVYESDLAGPSTKQRLTQ